MENEPQSRIKIDKLLEKAGWILAEENGKKPNVLLENRVNLGNDFEKTKNGKVDYTLLDKNGRPIAILEAKRSNLHPFNGKEQAREYAKSQNVSLVILSNGNLHYLWDIEQGNPEIISNFPSPDSLSTTIDRKDINIEEVKDDYIALTQESNFRNDPDWDLDRDGYIQEKGLKFLRPYQIEAIKSIQENISKGKKRFLFEMATGTGKTLISAGIIKLLLKTGHAKRVLFLVDRLELEDQAEKSFNKTLGKEYTTKIYKKNKDDWRTADILISTVQSLMINNKYTDIFTPTDFDFIISDEAHRTISGNSRDIFEYFIGYKLGLTATPKDYLKNIDEEDLSKKDPRKLEKRKILDTYTTFGCESGEPTFKYSLIDGIKDGFLINVKTYDARTKITTQMFLDKGFILDVGDEEKQFFKKDFEKKFFSEETNNSFCKSFIENAEKDPITGEIGKTIIFCVNIDHARKITETLNKLIDKIYPNKYNSDFAVQVTSTVKDAQSMSRKFAGNNLNGNTKFDEEYVSSKTRVCVTVGMMTTGYDCEDLLNVCLLRPIFSPTDFIQIKGRGTRKYNFNDIPKTIFKLFDFFANCEYFEKHFNYDEILKVNLSESSGMNIDEKTIEEYENLEPDPIIASKETEPNPKGMKIDREYFNVLVKKLKNDEELKKEVENENYLGIEKIMKSKYINKPEEFYTIEKIREALNIDRKIKLEEIIEIVFNGRRIKSSDEILEEKFTDLLKNSKDLKEDMQIIFALKNLFKAYILYEDIREIIDKMEFQRLIDKQALTQEDIDVLDREQIKFVVNYIKDYIDLEDFE